MSYFSAADPRCSENSGSVELTIAPRKKDLGEFSVRRVLPSRERRMVGPFIFFDHMGPAELPPGKGIQVRPNPHIGLATVTYLFEGEIIHRDSLGVVQPIRPGAVNLMTAGRGIVHSERAGDDLNSSSRLHGIQIWIALPDEAQEIEPAFAHYAAADIPQFERNGVAVRVVMGEAEGQTSPVASYSPTLYLECRMPAGSRFTVPGTLRELAAYVVAGEIGIGECACSEGVMAVASPGAEMRLDARRDCHVIVIGGEAVGPRHIWWNLVSSSKDRIEQAKDDWKNGRFASVPGDPEFIPLPD